MEPVNKGIRSLQTLRRLSLAAAFALLIVVPLLNYYGNITFVQGWYQSLGIGELRLISPLEGLESMLVSRQLSVPIVVGVLVPVLVAALLGRVFCSWICPISFLAAAMASLQHRLRRKKRLHDRLVLSKKVLWFALIGELLLSLILGAPLFVAFSPPGLVGRELMLAVYFQRLAWEGVLVVAVLVLELLTRRFYCRYFCPLGALLALIGSRRRLQVILQGQGCTGCARCALVCPIGLLPHQGESTTAYCWNCGACIERCPEQVLQFAWQPARGMHRNDLLVIK